MSQGILENKFNLKYKEQYPDHDFRESNTLKDRFIHLMGCQTGSKLALCGYNCMSNKEIIDILIAADNSNIKKLSYIKIKTAGDGQHWARLLTKLPYITMLNLNEFKLNSSVNNTELIPILSTLDKNNSLTSLNLNNNRIKFHEIHILGQVLETNKKLKHIYLKNNLIRSRGAATLFYSLQFNTVLQELDLEKNQIGPLAYKSWISNNSLTVLNLKLNNISTASGLLIANILKTDNHLTNLNLSQCQLGYTSIKYITTALQQNTTLRVLLLSDNDLCPQSGIQLAGLLAVNNSIRTLDLTKNDIQALGVTAIMKSLVRNSGLVNLNLAHNNIRYGAARHIAYFIMNNKFLYYLNLSNNSLYTEGTVAIYLALKYNKTLVELNISYNDCYNFDYIEMTRENERQMKKYNRIKYNSLDKFNYFNYLEILKLDGLNIVLEGAIALANMLKTNNTITEIHLAGNYIPNDGIIALAEALMVNNTVVTFNMNNNGNLQYSGATKISEMLKVNTCLTFLYMKKSGLDEDDFEIILDGLEFNRTIKELNLYDLMFYSYYHDISILNERHGMLLTRNKYTNYKIIVRTLKALTMDVIKKHNLRKFLN